LLLLLWYTSIILTIIIITILRIVRTYNIYYCNLYRCLLFIIFKFHNSYAEPKLSFWIWIFWFRSTATESSDGIQSFYSAGIIFLIDFQEIVTSVPITISLQLINAVAVHIPTPLAVENDSTICKYYDVVGGWVAPNSFARDCKYEEGHRKGNLDGGETNILILAAAIVHPPGTHSYIEKPLSI